MEIVSISTMNPILCKCDKKYSLSQKNNKTKVEKKTTVILGETI